VSLHALIAVPSAPLLLPAVSPAQPPELVAEVAALRDDVGRALQVIADVDTVILLAVGDEALVHDASRATLASYGHPGVSAELSHDEELLTAVASRGQIPRVRDDRLDGDLAVLAMLVSSAGPEVCLLSVTVPGAAGPDALAATAVGLSGAAASTDRRVAVVAAGDLASTLGTSSPGYLVEGATEWDAAVVSAFRAADADTLVALGPVEASRVQARGWAPLAVLLRIAEHQRHVFGEVSYHAPRGVGQLVAHR
jgi:hypothetical protein